MTILEHYVGKKVIDAAIVGPKADVEGMEERLVIQTALDASDVTYRR